MASIYDEGDAPELPDEGQGEADRGLTDGGQPEARPQASFETASGDPAAGRHTMTIQVGDRAPRYATYQDGLLVHDTGDAQAQQFGATLPMSQSELQRLDNLRQAYGNLLRNPNITTKDKAEALRQMAREIHFGQTRVQFQQRQQRMEGMQARGQAQSEQVGHQMAQGGMFANQVAELQKQFPDHDIEFSQKHGFHIKPKVSKPFSRGQAKGDAEDELRDERPDLFQERDASQFTDQIPEDQQGIWKNKYGKKDSTDEEKTAAASQGWAKEAEHKRKLALDAALHQRVSEKRQEHEGRGRASGNAPSAAAPPAPQQAAAQPPPVEEQRGSLIDSHQRQVQQLQKIEDPAERNSKIAAAGNLTALLHQNLGRPITPAVAAEIQRLKAVIGSRWGKAQQAAPTPHLDRSIEANRYAGGT